MLDVLVVFMLLTLLAVAGVAILVWDGRRRLRRKFERSTERALDDLAAETCDDLARGRPGERSRAAGRYEAVRDEMRSASRVRDLGKVAAKAEAHRWATRAEAGLRDLKERARGASRRGGGGGPPRRREDPERRSTPR